MARKKRHGGMPKGFVSKAQMRKFFADPKLRRFAHKEAHKAGMHHGRPGSKAAYHRLPLRKHAVRGRRVR